MRYNREDLPQNLDSIGDFEFLEQCPSNDSQSLLPFHPVQSVEDDSNAPTMNFTCVTTNIDLSQPRHHDLYNKLQPLGPWKHGRQCGIVERVLGSLGRPEFFWVEKKTVFVYFIIIRVFFVLIQALPRTSCVSQDKSSNFIESYSFCYKMRELR